MFKWLRQNTTSLAPIEEKVKDEFEFGTTGKEKLVMEDLIAENFVLLTKIGHGSFGDIILSYSLKEKTEVILKKEMKEKDQKSSPIHNELKAYQTLLDISNTTDISGIKPILQLEIQGIPKFYGFGDKGDYYYLIQEFLGPNLSQLLNYCGKKKFTLGTICLLAMQMLNRIEYIHKRHYIHRDIKLENFCIGNEENTNTIYLIDYGLAKRFKDNKTNQHIPYREGKLFIGTARYASINAHLGLEQSRRDDLISLGYNLIYMLKGGLPWQGIKGKDKINKLAQKKIQIPNDVLCNGLPNEFLHYLNYCKNLKFEERPDYKFLKGLFGRLLGLVITNYNLKKSEVILDWCFKDVEQIWSIYLNKEENSKNTKKNEESKEEEEDDNDNKDIIEEDSDENGSKKDGLKSYFESSLGDDSDKSSIEESDIKQSSGINANYNISNKQKSGSSLGRKKSTFMKKIDINEMNNIKENSEESYDSSCDTIKNEFEPKKLCTNIKEIKQEQKLDEEVDKQIFKIIGKSLEDYITPQDDIDKITEENKENNENKESNINKSNLYNSKINSDIGINKDLSSTLQKKITTTQFKNRLKTMVEKTKKKKGKLNHRKSAVLQNPIMDLNFNKKLTNQASLKGKERPTRVYDLQFL